MRPNTRTRADAPHLLHRARTCALAAALGALSTTTLIAQNLVVNPGFEAGLQGWTVVSSNVTVVSYGSADVPGLAVANAIGGGNRLVRDTGGGAILEQVVVTGPLMPNENIEVRGFLGGVTTTDDYAEIVLRFLDGTGGEIALRNVSGVSSCEPQRRVRAPAEAAALRAARRDRACGRARPLLQPLLRRQLRVCR
jgi:hypothetical protein